MAKVDLDQLSDPLADRLQQCGFQSRTTELALGAMRILQEDQPITLRGLLYRAVSSGLLPSTDSRHYDRLGRVVGILREKGVVPFDWIVDNVRQTHRQSSWSGLADYADTVRDCYRRDFWAELPAYVHVFVEKDASAGTILPVTEEFDVPLTVCRGYASLSLIHREAMLWRDIPKPIFAYYLGDLDPSGMDMERNLQDKLREYSGRTFEWERLGVCGEDFEALGLLPLEIKKADSRRKSFLAMGYDRGAELEAIPAPILRERVREAIDQHIPAADWNRLLQTEALERETWYRVLANFEVAQ